jgi:hypothetical protein
MTSRTWGLVYAWSGVLIMWAFWTCFVVFLASPPWAERDWPLPTVDTGGRDWATAVALLIDAALISLFGLQHSLMARPWFKRRLSLLPPPFVRVTFVHAANLALFALIAFWQPVPILVWDLSDVAKDAASLLFTAGWAILLLGALSFGIFDLLGVSQMHAWYRREPEKELSLKTGVLYRFLRHPMYVGVLMAMWATPRMSVGHALLAGGMTLYVMIALRYEERDLQATYGKAYAKWREQDAPTMAGARSRAPHGALIR